MSTPVPRSDFPSEAAYEAAALSLGCDVPAIKAVAKVEAGPQGAFIDGGFAPTILFERHVFDRLTGGVFRYAFLPGVPQEIGAISAPTPGGYGPYALQHPKLVLAVAHDRDAALKSASWGLFQIMGFNHRECGYPTLQKFINAMFRGVDDHLLAFVEFIRGHLELHQAIINHNWTRFARIYNGPNYDRPAGRRLDYDTRIAYAYDLILKSTGEDGRG